ncbi:MAG: hypothetical protein C0467_12305 [Planctomycetaceae bacterium]|nr:hypothetical protein [Planctomycetaceae bacterium]
MEEVTMASRSEISRLGQCVSDVLRGSWRYGPLPVATIRDVAEICPLLIRLGVGALAGRRCLTGILDGWVEEFRQIRLWNAVQEAVQAQQLIKVVDTLGSVGVPFLLLKGWSVARLYPEPGLRPVGDIDICVPPEALTDARAALRSDNYGDGVVDLHAGLPDLHPASFRDLWSRRQTIPIGGQLLSVLGSEDQLKHLCLHWARHGGWRAIWLCDIAVACEALPRGVNWRLIVGGPEWQSAWVRGALSLTTELLGTKPSKGSPSLTRAPRWLVRAVLDAWGRGRVGDSHTCEGRSIFDYFRTPLLLPHGLRQRWPLPIEAVCTLQKSLFTRWPIPLLQAGYSLRRAWRKLTQPASTTADGINSTIQIHVSR